MGRLYDTTPLMVFGILLGRGGRNIVRIEAEDDFKETVYYTHNRALTHKKFQQLQQHANVLWKRYPDKSPACKSRVAMNFQLQLSRKFGHLIAAWKGKVSFL